MSELLHNLGINGKLLIASTVNFFLLFLVLRRFVYGPVVRMLEKREKTVADSLKHSAEVESVRNSLAVEREKIVLAAKTAASDLLQEAAQRADRLRADALTAARTDADALVAKTKAALAEERAALMDSVRHDVADLVVTATEKILEQKMTDKADHALIAKTIAQLEAKP